MSLGERRRTLIGHFRHEVGHFYWQLLVPGHDEAAYKRVFGDHESPTYAEALDRHYQEGPPADWARDHVSPYATMHSWEDFAETWGTYLDLAGVLDTARHAGLTGTDVTAEKDVAKLTAEYGRIGVFMTEMNRTMGLTDFVPQSLGPGVLPKLTYVHDLIAGVRGA